VLAFSHLRWNFVYQRPQHLLTRFQRTRDVHFWEEVVIEPRETPELRISNTAGGVQVITPLLPPGLTDRAIQMTLRTLLDEYLAKHRISDFIAWYYTPMALKFSDHLAPDLTVYDCMDELSAFQGAPPELISMEKELFSRADIAFCGGASLYAAKRRQHGNVHLFPSSIDREHFAPARAPQPDPPDQAGIPHPRIGFYGVLDERLDRELLDQVAALRPGYHFVLLGPVVKIEESELPRHPNLHYLSQKSYDELPRYLSNWDVAMLPFALNASTQFISPTKTPEYLAGGKPVVSTPIRDVVKPYGEMNLVKIAANPAEFAEAIDSLLAGSGPEWLNRVDEQLAAMSWDRTFEGISTEIQACARPRTSGLPTSKSGTERSTANV
jgi:glycosyltransferase involved in cell wall biosynthesis